MTNANGTERKKKWKRRSIAGIVLVLLIALFARCMPSRQVALEDIRWNMFPEQIEIIFNDQESIRISSGEQSFPLRVELTSVFSRNRTMLCETPQDGNFKVRFEYNVRVFFALFIPLVQDWGGTATFYADASLEEEIRDILEYFSGD